MVCIVDVLEILLHPLAYCSIGEKNLNLIYRIPKNVILQLNQMRNLDITPVPGVRQFVFADKKLYQVSQR